MRAAGYVRVSTDEQAREGLSLDMQEARIRAYCDSQEWELLHVLREEGYSGKTTDRPALELLRGSIRDTNDVQVVVVYKVDRLTRKQRDLWNLLEEWDKAGVAFKSVSEPFDTTTAQGKAFLGMLAVFAQLERDTTAERTRDALREKMANGGHVGIAPYGYEARDGELHEIAKEQKIRKAIFLNRANGDSYARIAEDLRIERVPTKRGGRWHASTVRSILKGAIVRQQEREG